MENKFEPGVGFTMRDETGAERQLVLLDTVGDENGNVYCLMADPTEPDDGDLYLYRMAIHADNTAELTDLESDEETAKAIELFRAKQAAEPEKSDEEIVE